jgi:two-component system, NarL family, sensor kinase
MSDATKAWLQSTGSLTPVLATMAAVPRSTPAAGLPDVMQLRFTRVLDLPHSVLLSAGMSGAVWYEWLGKAPTAALLGLQGTILAHNLRLLGVHERLAASVRSRRKGGGRKLVEQIERERQRIGRDLHTGVGQLLAAMHLQVEMVRTQAVRPQPAAVESALERLAMLCEQALAQVRAVSHGLYPPEWQRLSLAGALRQMWEASGVPQHFQASLDLQATVEPAHTVKVVLYRAAQEAILNLIRHSNAAHASLTLLQDGDRLVLRVADDGSGFDSQATLSGPPRVTAGLGLRSLKEQVEALAGEFRIHSGSGGTTLEVSIPFKDCGEL